MQLRRMCTQTVHPVELQANLKERISNKNLHMIRLNLIQVIAFIVFNLPNTMYSLYSFITRTNQKTSDQILIDNFFNYIASYLLYTHCAVRKNNALRSNYLFVFFLLIDNLLFIYIIINAISKRIVCNFSLYSTYYSYQFSSRYDLKQMSKCPWSLLLYEYPDLISLFSYRSYEKHSLTLFYKSTFVCYTQEKRKKKLYML
jgi:hypothetical protein